ncbi:hypothetical protein C7G41_24075 [Bradyrhizobium sp. MOS002]|nr:hypothetical protein C7G41_24075 [Bradyrhizobium sp. MOS002]
MSNEFVTTGGLSGIALGLLWLWRAADSWSQFWYNLGIPFILCPLVGGSIGWLVSVLIGAK